jgi:hypothetical protein
LSQEISDGDTPSLLPTKDFNVVAAGEKVLFDSIQSHVESRLFSLNQAFPLPFQNNNLTCGVCIDIKSKTNSSLASS